MRVEAINQIAQVYKTDKTAECQRVDAAGSGRDEVQISAFGHDYQIAKQAVAEASDIREDKVAELSAKINSNEYDVSTEDFAAKLLERYRALEQ
jgi:negative regulator of flagellin synthesis FlgM